MSGIERADGRARPGPRAMLERLHTAISNLAYITDPDVLLRESGTLRLVGDAKYRDWPGTDNPSMHAEVYQLLAHAKAYGCDRAFLAYPGDEYAVVDLGTAVTGCRVWAFSFNLRELQQSADHALAAMLP